MTDGQHGQKQAEEVVFVSEEDETTQSHFLLYSEKTNTVQRNKL